MEESYQRTAYANWGRGTELYCYFSRVAPRSDRNRQPAVTYLAKNVNSFIPNGSDSEET